MTFLLNNSFSLKKVSLNLPKKIVKAYVLDVTEGRIDTVSSPLKWQKYVIYGIYIW